MDMLNAVVTDINTVDEGLRGFYKEADGKFVLQVAPVDGFALENITGLTNSLGAERNLKKTLEATVKQFEGIDPKLAREAIARVAEYGDLTPEQAREAKEMADTLSKLDPKKDAERIAQEKIDAELGKVQKLFDTEKSGLTAQIEAFQGTVASLKGQLKTLLVTNQIKDGLAPLNPLDDARDVIQLLAEKYIQSDEVDGAYVVNVLDDEGKPRYVLKDGQAVPMSVGDLLAEIKEKRPSLFKADDKRGVGITPNTGSSGQQVQDNPWVPGAGFNRTQQALITKRDPQLAARLKAQAGAA
jgi:hypothetical protein